MSKSVMGEPLDRVDGRAKVTGGARYAADMPVANVAYGVLATSTIAAGKVKEIDTRAAEKSPGVLAVLTHRNMPKASLPDDARAFTDPSVGQTLQPLQTDVIYHNGQPIAVVIAESFEQATCAAALVKAEYHEDLAVTSMTAARPVPPAEAKTDRGKRKPREYRRGDPDKALADAAVRIEQTYSTPSETHNPMELHATLAVWEGPKLTLYDKTQWVDNVRDQVAAALHMSKDDVRVMDPFMGGGFGTGLRVWAHTYIAALAARVVRRPVKLVLTRAQTFTMTGFRPHSVQTVALGADKKGKLSALRHDATTETSNYEEYTETVLMPARVLYACPNVGPNYRIAPWNVNTPAPMRGPGEASGVYALECALDELAVELGMDPLELRLVNYADVDPDNDHPWSSKSLKECYQQAAERFGWSKRNPKPGSMRDGHVLIGYGMATATWPTHRAAASAQVQLLADGSAVVRTATSDIGPGTYTSMTQIAAALGLPVKKVRCDLADTRWPPTPPQGGSMTLASVGSAVHEAAIAVRDEVLKFAGGDERSPLHGAKKDGVAFEDGRVFLKDNAKQGEAYTEILQRHSKDKIELTRESKPGDEFKKYGMRAFGAQFAQVRVDLDLRTVRVARIVCAIAAGKIVNPKTAHSQAIGGIVGGIGMALLEETIHDQRNARVVNANLADYHVPVHADTPPIDAFFVEEQDKHVNPLGAKGLAELTLVGVAPAIANAVYHATGKRIRDLPITLDKLL